MRFKSTDLKCEDCSHTFTALLSKEEIAAEDYGTCEACESENVRRTIGTPMVLKDSYRDGYKRGPGFQRYKESLKLKQEVADIADPKQKAEATKTLKAVEKASRTEKH